MVVGYPLVGFTCSSAAVLGHIPVLRRSIRSIESAYGPAWALADAAYHEAEDSASPVPPEAADGPAPQGFHGCG